MPAGMWSRVRARPMARLIAALVMIALAAAVGMALTGRAGL